MNNYIKYLENEQIEEAYQYLTASSEILKQKSEDGWNCIQLASYYNAPNIIRYCLENMSEDLINSSKHPLLIAIEEKNKDSINVFLESNFENKINWETKDKNGENLIHLSIFYGLEEYIPNLVNKGIDCSHKNNQGISPIQLSIERGNQKLFDYLNDYINMSEKYEEVYIKKSIHSDNVTIFERLYPYSNLSVDDLFSLAVGFGSVKVLSAIINDGRIILGSEQVTSVIDLMCKSYEKEDDKKAAESIAQYLFSINIPFNKFINQQGQSAWMLCIQNNNEHIFEKLMQTSENVNVIDSEGHSPLFYAIEKNNVDFVKLLLKKKANPNQLDKGKNTPLIKAVQKNNPEIVQEILQYMPLVNEVNISNEHALSIAIKNRRMDLVSDLIWAGGEITTNPVKMIEEKQMFFFGASGSTERNSYYDEENIDNFVSLVKLGFKINQINSEGDTFLLHFIKNGYISNFSALMKCNINPNQTDLNGNSPLMCAASKRQNEYFNAMINKFSNIDYNITNKYGENVYDICFKMGKAERMEKLLIADQNINQEDLKKVAKIISKDGNLSINHQKINEKGLDLTFLDDNGNSLLVYALIGKNLDNFKFLINNTSIDINNKNNLGHTIQDMVNSMPEELSIDFKQALKSKINKKP